MIASAMSGRHLFLTGIPGIGKTTRIMEAVEWILSIQVLDDISASAPDIPHAGITTQEVRDERIGKRIGFEAIGVQTQEKVMVAHIDWHSSCDHKVGKYGVHPMAFEYLLQTEMDILTYETSQQPRLVILDEIGRMEACSNRFRSIVEESLQERIVLATISQADHRWIKKIRQHPDANVIELTKDNRRFFTDEHIIPWLRKHYQIPESVPNYATTVRMV
jgi:nucleoside-triphosphatase THEP1